MRSRELREVERRSCSRRICGSPPRFAEAECRSSGAPDLHVRSDANAILYRRVMRHLLDSPTNSERMSDAGSSVVRRRMAAPLDRRCPGGEPTEPCEAWWIQAGDAFVDVRVAAPGMEDNGLPYSSTRAFAGRFEIADGEVRWHVELDSDGPVPRTDRAAAAGLYIAVDDPLLMIEDAPGRFREEWVQHAPEGDVEFVHIGEPRGRACRWRQRRGDVDRRTT